jgi:hypothetical protein
MVLVISGAEPVVYNLEDLVAKVIQLKSEGTGLKQALADKGISAKLHNRSPEVGDFANKTGKMRGTLDGNDDFATLQFSISWNFLNNACKNNF